MANSSQIYDAVSLFMRDQLRRVDTIKPGVVTNVTGNKLSAKILTKTKYSDGSQEEQPEVVDIPFFVLSANKGAAAITMPVSVGDNVMVLFSDRDYGELMSTDGQSAVDATEVVTHRYEPILALPCWFTEPNEVENDTDNVEIRNGSTKIVMAPDGSVTVDTTATIINSNTTINGNLSVSGNVDASGNVDSGGDITAAGEVSGTGDLGEVKLTTHTHNYNPGPGSPTPTTPGTG